MAEHCVPTAAVAVVSRTRLFSPDTYKLPQWGLGRNCSWVQFLTGRHPVRSVSLGPVATIALWKSGPMKMIENDLYDNNRSVSFRFVGFCSVSFSFVRFRSVSWKRATRRWMIDFGPIAVSLNRPRPLPFIARCYSWYPQAASPRRTLRRARSQLMTSQLKSTATAINFCLQCFCLQCFDAVGWAAGRASGL